MGHSYLSYQSPKVWERFFNLPFEERIDDLITIAVPWYYSFIVSWRKAAELGIIDGLFLRYEDLPGGEEDFLRRIIQFAGLEASDEEIEAGISAARGDKDRSRLNKGINGRGKKLYRPNKWNEFVGWDNLFARTKSFRNLFWKTTVNSL